MRDRTVMYTGWRDAAAGEIVGTCSPSDLVKITSIVAQIEME